MLCTSAIGCALFFAPINSSALTLEERRALPIESNSIENWPKGPVVSATSAIVLEANSGVILYEKNIRQKMYPASTTKLMTTMIAYENSSLGDIVTVSKNAVDSVPADGSNIGLSAGESITMEQALYGIMVGSGNEAANAVAEHVAGSIDGFVALMNERAKSLGLDGTHFANVNGLHADNHYTSAYDLAIIAAEFFKNSALSEIGGCARYHFEKSKTQPDDFYITNKHKLITGEIACEGVIGGKTGFTDEAGECLVTCAERDGLKLICVVMFEESPDQYNDSASLLEYGFSHFANHSLENYDTSIFPEAPSFFSAEQSLFERDIRILKFEDTSNCVLPANTDMSEVTHFIKKTEAKGVIAELVLNYMGIEVGKAPISSMIISPIKKEKSGIIYVNLYSLLFKLISSLIIFSIPILGIRGYVLHTKTEKYKRKRRLKRHGKRRFTSGR